MDSDFSESDCSNQPADSQQLERQFQQAWQQAIEHPEQANLLKLWQAIEPFLPALSDIEQLHLASLMFTQLTELHVRRFDRLLAGWEDQHSDEGPMIDLDLLQGLVQRTMHLDLSDLVRQRQPVKPSPRQTVVGTVEKQKVLQMIEDIESEADLKQQALHVAHDENVGVWIEQVSQWMQHQPQAVSLPELVQAVNLPLVKVWLALLLGNYKLESRGQFYAADQIWICGFN